MPLFAALHHDHMTLYRDMSGDSLHRRGYRDAMHRASLNEAAAAGALQLAGWPDTVRASQRRGSSACCPLLSPISRLHGKSQSQAGAAVVAHLVIDIESSHSHFDV